MGRDKTGRTMKNAWIDEGKRIVSFTPQENATQYREEEPAFWNRILNLMQTGYRMQ